MVRAVLAMLLAAGICSGTSTVHAAPDLALILNGTDNTLSTVDLASGTSSFNLAALGGAPGFATLAGGRFAAVVSGADRVLVFDANTLALESTLPTGPGSSPYAVAGDGTGGWLVTLFATGEVVRFDAGGNETARAAVGRSPEGIVVRENRAYVANSGFRFSDYGYDPGTVTVLDPVTLAPLGTVPVGLNPQWPVAAGNELHVLCTGDYVSVFGEVHILDAATFAPLDTVALGGSPGFLAVGDDRGYASAYFGGITSYRVSTREVLRDAGNPLLFGGTGYSGLALDGEGNLLVALYEDDVVARVDLATETVTAAFATGAGPGSIVLREEAPVPVRLAAFTARATGNGIVLAWSLREFDGIATVRVDRSGGGAGTTTLARMTPRATGAFTDRAPSAGTLTYTLVAEHRDGSAAVLGDRTVHHAPPPLALALRSHPVRGTLELSLRTDAPGPVELALYTVEGRRVGTWNLAAGNTDEVRSLDVARFGSGVYILRAARGEHAAQRRVVLLAR